MKKKKPTLKRPTQGAAGRREAEGHAWLVIYEDTLIKALLRMRKRGRNSNNKKKKKEFKFRRNFLKVPKLVLP